MNDIFQDGNSCYRDQTSTNADQYLHSDTQIRKSTEKWILVFVLYAENIWLILSHNLLPNGVILYCGLSYARIQHLNRLLDCCLNNVYLYYIDSFIYLHCTLS